MFFLFRKTVSVCQNFCTSGEQVQVLFILLLSCKQYDKTVRVELSKECNLNFVGVSSSQLNQPTETRDLGVSSASFLAIPAFFGSPFDASDFCSTIFWETFTDDSFKKALEKWLCLTHE